MWNGGKETAEEAKEGQVEVHGGGLDAELRGIASASQGTGHSVAKAGCGGSHPRLVGAEPVQSWPRGSFRASGCHCFSQA